MGHAILWITAIELAWANGSHVVTAPVDVLREPAVANLTKEQDEQKDAVCVERVFRPPQRRWVPQRWPSVADSGRAAETMRWDRASLLPKYHLLGPYGSVHSFNTMSSRHYRALMRIAGSERRQLHVLSCLGVRYLLLPSDSDTPDGLQLKSDAPTIENLAVWENPDRMPRCWLVHEVESSSAEMSADPLVVEARLRQVFFPRDVPRDLYNSAVVQSEVPPEPLGPAHNGREMCVCGPKVLGTWKWRPRWPVQGYWC